MTILNKIAYFQNRRDEVPNQELARELVKTQNLSGIGEIAENLWNKDKNVQNDCIKVLYEIGYQKPELIAEFVHDFLKLLSGKNNRLIWGAMIALSTIAAIKVNEIHNNLDKIYAVMEVGSVITIDNGIKTLAVIATANTEYNLEIFPFLTKYLQTCRPSEIPRHAENILVAVNPDNKNVFVEVLNQRQNDLTPVQIARIKRSIGKLRK